jgi:hypothetical protein
MKPQLLTGGPLPFDLLIGLSFIGIVVAKESHIGGLLEVDALGKLA